MPPDRFTKAVGRQAAGQRLAEHHQLLELFGARARLEGFGGRGGRFRLHLAALRILVEHEHDQENQQRRAQRDAVGLFDIARGVEDVLDRPLEDDQQGEGEPREEEGVLPADDAYAHGV